MRREDIARAAGADGCPAAQMAPLTLAYVGDAVYELAVRTMLAGAHDAKSAALHAMSVRRVCAHAQALVAAAVEPMLDEQERGVFMRARNAKPHSLPKHADPGEYAEATALEAVLGYLYLQGCEERLEALLKIVFRELLNVEDRPKPRPYKG